jgi:hypothetical protein
MGTIRITRMYFLHISTRMTQKVLRLSYSCSVCAAFCCKIRQPRCLTTLSTPDEVLEEALDHFYRHLKSKKILWSTMDAPQDQATGSDAHHCWWFSWVMQEQLEPYEKGGQNKPTKVGASDLITARDHSPIQTLLRSLKTIGSNRQQWVGAPSKCPYNDWRRT